MTGNPNPAKTPAGRARPCGLWLRLRVIETEGLARDDYADSEAQRQTKGAPFLASTISCTRSIDPSADHMHVAGEANQSLIWKLATTGNNNRVRYESGRC
jgi:hypothetical protein